MKYLNDGEIKDVKSKRNAVYKTDKFVGIKAERVDCETPYVHLSILGQIDGVVHCADPSIILTDVDVEDLIERLQRALSMLPTSK